MDIFVAGNYVEAGVWIVIGLICGVLAGLKTGVVRQRLLCSIPVFIAFGVSDIVEVQTGAWWRPWWLFVWKGSCVLGMVVLLVDYFQRRGRAP